MNDTQALQTTSALPQQKDLSDILLLLSYEEKHVLLEHSQHALGTF